MLQSYLVGIERYGKKSLRISEVTLFNVKEGENQLMQAVCWPIESPPEVADGLV